MATTLTAKSINLLSEYKYLTNWKDFRKRKDVKQKIYEIEIPRIRESLKNLDFSALLHQNDIHRIYVNAFYTATSTKRVSMYKLMQIIRSNSLYSAFVRFQLKTLYKCLLNLKVPFSVTEKVVNFIHPINIGYFCAITNSNLDVFKYIKAIDRKR